MKAIGITLFVVILNGCASLNDFFGFVDEQKKEVVKVEEVKEPLTRYSNVQNYAPVADRNYKRMTRERMEDESELHSGAGSLWVMEGQTSYLFAQNKNRREGDPTVVKLEGSALRTVQVKAETIKELLVELENQKREAEEKKRKEEAVQQRLVDIDKEKKLILSKNEADNEDSALQMAEQRVDARKPASVAPAAKPKDPSEDKIDLKGIANFPMKITEKIGSGQYRLTGQQMITIKNKPYKLIATALVRNDDYSDEFISSEKLFDAQYDIVHVKKGE